MQANFRNLAGRPLELLVAHLAAEYLDMGTKVLIRAPTAERIKALDQALWTFDPASFLPHGTEESGRAEGQPVLLTTGEGNPNGATALLLMTRRTDSGRRLLRASSRRLSSTSWRRCARSFDRDGMPPIERACVCWVRRVCERKMCIFCIA